MWRGLIIARQATDPFGALLAGGLSFWLATEAFINMAVMVGLMPFAGNALPFISSGGSNLVVTLAAVGTLMSVSRVSYKVKSNEEKTYSAIVDLRGGTGGGVYPALAVHSALTSKRANVETLWVGGEEGMEADLVKRANIPFAAIPTAGVHGVGLRTLPNKIFLSWRAVWLVGNRFNGKVFVSAVQHVIEEGNWITVAEFGLPPEWFAERRDQAAPPAAGWLPGVEGLQIGVVKKLDGDPEGEQKVQVSVPVMQADTDEVWARLAGFYGSNGIGALFIPEVGDEVVLGYMNNDPCHPIILGSFYSSKRKPPYDLTADNFIKAIVTKSNIKLIFDDENKVLTLHAGQ